VGVIRGVLAPKLRGLCAKRSHAGRIPPADPQNRSIPPPPPISNAEVEAIAIGTSVGGPQALSVVIPALPKTLDAAVLIVQHMPALFTKQLAERLAASAALNVVEATAGMPIERGTVYLAPGDHHMLVSTLAGRPCISLNQGPLENGCRPAVDVLFRSAATAYGPTLLAVIMTGMGSDGTAGAREVRRTSGRVWAQDEASSSIWGMAGSVVKAGLAERIVRLDALANDLTRIARRSFSSQTGLSPRARSRT
jgi:two-component system chemotaxis response regulator CheB